MAPRCGRSVHLTAVLSTKRERLQQQEQPVTIHAHDETPATRGELILSRHHYEAVASTRLVRASSIGTESYSVHAHVLTSQNKLL